MGIDIHNLNLLAHAGDLGVRYERTLAIGRQALFIDDADLERHRRARGLAPLVEPARQHDRPRWFESLMTQWLGAAVVDSVDASPYEEARLIHDMNLPWPEQGNEQGAELGSFDAVLDFGCLEHVFNFPVAWRNCVDLCRVGGHLIHSLPANNLSGHGFYQFSPELFFNLYQRAAGFELLGVYFAMKADPRHWWKVANPLEVHRRVNLRNSHEVYMLVIAKKLRAIGALPAPQQSDYAQQEWLSKPSGAPAVVRTDGTRRALARQLARLGLMDAARALRERLRVLRSSGMALPAPDYQRVDVAALIGRQR